MNVIGLDGENQKLRIVAMPRYTNLNFFELSGKPAKLEDYRKEQGLNKYMGKDESKSKDKKQGTGKRTDLVRIVTGCL